MILVMNPTMNSPKINYWNILACLVFLAPFIFLILAKPNDWFGIILILLTIIFIFTQRVFIQKKATIIAILMVFFIKVLISLVNSNYFTIYGAGADSKGFFNNATLISQSGFDINLLNTGGTLYENILALMFNIVGVSQFNGEMLSIFVFIVAVSFLLKITERLYGSNNNYNTLLVYLFGLLPSMLIYTSIIMREPFQVLFFLMSVYYYMESQNNGTFSLKVSIKFLTAVFLLGLFHNGLLLFTFVLIGIYVFKLFRNQLRIKSVVIRLAISALILFLFIGLLDALGISTQASEALLSGDMTSYVDNYRDGGIALDARAQYGVELDTSNIFMVLGTLPLVFTNYMVAPFPWQVSSVIDIYAFMENIFRAILLYCSFRCLKRLENSKRKTLIGIMVLFIIVEVLWSLGTVNWGTAVRHHLIGYALVLVMGTPFLKAKLMNLGNSFR
ncbi:hypothetical protein [Lentibacillus persicus]|nr:hypothetical protein [Lentibacillus persicus]